MLDMPLRDITREAVLAAIREYDELGAESFREQYGYGPARVYQLRHDGRTYDSKAIVGVAQRYVSGQPLAPREFSGGDQTVGRLLLRLGFEVKRSRNPDWTRDELILACALVAENGWRGLSETDPRVIELSALLQRMPLHAPMDRGDTFRNPNGVARKTWDIATAHPDYTGRPTNGGQADREVLATFLRDPARMRAVAAAIRFAVESGTVDDTVPAEDLAEEDIEAPEGRLLLRQHFSRERSAKLRRRKIDTVLKATGRLACEACGFDFAQAYGERGEGYIECHHVVPLHEAGEKSNRASDLALLCANCHRMVHRRSPWMTPAEIASMLAQRRSPSE